MQTAISTSYRRNLGDELVLRWSTAEDTERIATLHSMVHRDKAEDPPNTNVKRVIHRLMNGDHPFMGPNDFGVIEDTGKEGNPVVACTCLWKHTWTYEGIPFSVGRPEIVGLYNRRRASSIVSESISRKQWLYEIETWKEHPELGHAFNFQMIVDAAGQTAGFVATDARRRDKGLGVWLLEFAEGVNMQTAMPSVLRALHSS